MTKFTIYPSKPISVIGDRDDVYHTVTGRLCSFAPKQQEEEDARKAMPFIGIATHQLNGVRGSQDFRAGAYQRQLTTKRTYHNYTDGQITICERNGVPLVYNPDIRDSGFTEPCVVIRHEIAFDDMETMKRTLAALRQLGETASSDLRQAKTQLISDAKRISLYGYRLEFEYVVTLEEMQRQGGSAYHRKTDTVLSILPLDRVPRHPHTADSTSLGIGFNLEPDPHDDINVVVRYVSPDPEANPLYMNFANKILKLIPQTGHPEKLVSIASPKGRRAEPPVEMAEYIEFIYTAKSEGSDERGIRYARLSVDDAKEAYGIFSSHGDAVNAKATLEATVRTQKQKLDGQEAAFQERAAATAREHAEQLRAMQDKLRDKDATISAKNEEIQDLKKSNTAENERVKEKREGQAHKQKMNFEIVKFVISVVTMVLGIVPLLLKLYKPAGKTA